MMSKWNKKKIVSQLIILSVFIIAFTLSSCKKEVITEPPLECRITYTVKESAGSITEKDDALLVRANRTERIVIQYSIFAPSKDTLCSFELAIQSDGQLADNADIQAICIADVNSKYLSASKASRDENTFSQKQVMTLDEDGHCDLEVTYTVSGEVKLLLPVLREIAKDEDYYVGTLNNGARLVLWEEDMRNAAISSETVLRLCAELDRLRSSIKALCGGYEPYAGCTDIVFTENNQYTALAGNPIYVNHEDLELFFKPINGRIQKTDGIAILCHELSHTFDRENYCFDKEFFAAFKQIYALAKNGYAIDYDFLMNSPKLSGGIYNYEVALRRILETLNVLSEGWSNVEQCILDLHSLKTDTRSDVEKFDYFINSISDGDPRGFFSSEELALIYKVYSDS